MNTVLRALTNRVRATTICGTSPSRVCDSVQAALGWLCLAQDAHVDGGFSRAYSLSLGWELPYPETTGYMIPTFLEHSPEFPELNLRERALRAGKWLAAIQFDSGAICSKVYTPTNSKPSVFNTGMVLHGWTSLLAMTPDVTLAAAAAKAVRWLIAEQERDGSWIRNAYNKMPHSYYTMVDWALLRYAQLIGSEEARECAIRHLDWTVAQQRPNGWICRAEFALGEAVTTHTLSYTTQGLVESERLSGERRYVDAAIAATVPLREAFERTGTLAGTFNDQWQPTAAWECCTGSAQTSLAWQAIAALTGDDSWRAAARRLNQQMLRYQKIGTSNAGVNGAIPGSWPRSGDYDRYNFPNHAAKFHIDAVSNC